MTGDNYNLNESELEMGEELLKQLFHLKRYETPEVARMTRNRQNIMRQVREASRNKRKSLSDLIEISYPWFFAEPKYGVALLFVAFAGLQYMGVNARHAAQSDTGIYTTSTDRFAAYEQASVTGTNTISYPEFPQGATLFRDYQGRKDVKFVEMIEGSSK